MDLKDILSKDKDTVLFFMNSTCSLCRSQEKLFAENWDKVKEKINLYLLSVDFDVARVKSYKETSNVPFPVLHDADASVLQSIGYSATPGLVVLDGKGVIKRKVSGYQQAELTDYIKKLTR